MPRVEYEQASVRLTCHPHKKLKGMKVGETSFKVHLDGYNLLPLLTGQQKEGPRKEFYYFNDDSELVGLRYDNWKFVFSEQRATGTLKIWGEPFVTLDTNPTAENIARLIYEQAAKNGMPVTEVTLWETENSFATYRPTPGAPHGSALFRMHQQIGDALRKLPRISR